MFSEVCVHNIKTGIFRTIKLAMKSIVAGAKIFATLLRDGLCEFVRTQQRVAIL